METFYFLIPNGVIAEMGLTTDGQTVSKQVRLRDLFAGGQINVNEYHALASAGMVFLPVDLFTFESVEETAQGWVCQFTWLDNLSYLNVIFPGGVLQPLENGKEWQLWLPEPPPKGFFYSALRVRTRDVLKERGYCVLPYGRRIYSFSEGSVIIEPDMLAQEWVELKLYHKEQDSTCGSYLAQGGRYEIMLEYLRRCY